MFARVFAVNGFLTPSSSGGGDTIWGTVLWAVIIFAFCIYRSTKKKISLADYISQKYIRLNNLINSAEIVKTAVEEFNAGNPTGLKASYTKSEICGGYVSVRDDQGAFLAEVPSRRIGAWFWFVVTIFAIYVLT